MEWLCCRWPWVTPKHVKPPHFLHFTNPLCIFVIGDRKDYKFDVKVECASHSPWLGRAQVMWPITKFWGSNHITGTAEPKVVKFCTGVRNVNSMQQDDISPTKGRVYGHVTVLEFCL